MIQFLAGSHVVQDAEGEHLEQNRSLDRHGVNLHISLNGLHPLEAFVLKFELEVGDDCVEHNLQKYQG